MMETIELQLDKQTFARILQLAESRHCTLEELIKQMIEQLGAAETTDDPFLGMFADGAELIDQVMEDTMMSREAHPLRQSNG
jgi:hypothetical protein